MKLLRVIVWAAVLTLCAGAGWLYRVEAAQADLELLEVPVPRVSWIPPNLARAEGYSNVMPADYVGPAACKSCHEENWAGWNAHPHSRMNQNATEETVIAPFDGREVAFRGFYQAAHERRVPSGRARMWRDEQGRFLMTLSTPEGKQVRTFEVTRTIGWRLQQMFVGTQIEGPEPKSDPIWSDEYRLPLGWSIAAGRFLTIPYYDEYYTIGDELPPEATPRLDRWTECIICHNTYPYVRRAEYGLDFMLGYRRSDLAGEGTMPRPDRRPVRVDELVTLGISCEACHLGGREHVEAERPMSFVPMHPDLRFDNGFEIDAETQPQKQARIVNSLCRQCHGRAAATHADGSVSTNSAEQYDMRDSCNGELKCSDCHEPHTKGPAVGGGPDNPAFVEACAGCHPGYGADHSRHSEQVTCLDCHMPRLPNGLETITRSHHVSSPTSRAAFETAAPNACNLCHLDKPFRWTLSQLNKGWNVRPLGDGSPSGEWWARVAVDHYLNHPQDPVRAVAADAIARVGGEGALARLRGPLNDPYPRLRFLAQRAAERLLGRKLTVEEYDVAADWATRSAQLDALIGASAPAAAP